MKRLLRTIGIVAVILAILVVLKNEYACLLMSHANYGLQALITEAKENHKAREEEPYDLYLGSSMFRQGLDIEELNAASGNNYILAYNDAQPFLICKELEYLLAHNVPIRSITADMYVYTTLEEPWIEDTRLLIDTDLGFKRGLWQEMRQTAGASLADWWEMFVASNNDKLLIWPVDYALVNPMFEDGGNLLTNSGTSKEVLDAALEERGRTSAGSYQMDARQASYLLQLIALSEENDIELTFLETPKYGTLAYDAQYVEIMHLYCAMLQEHGVAYAISEATADSLRTNGYDVDVDLAEKVVSFDSSNAAYYIDLIHLSSDGRKEFTAAYLR